MTVPEDSHQYNVLFWSTDGTCRPAVEASAAVAATSTTIVRPASWCRLLAAARLRLRLLVAVPILSRAPTESYKYLFTYHTGSVIPKINFNSRKSSFFIDNTLGANTVEMQLCLLLPNWLKQSRYLATYYVHILIDYVFRLKQFWYYLENAIQEWILREKNADSFNGFSTTVKNDHTVIGNDHYIPDN